MVIGRNGARPSGLRSARFESWGTGCQTCFCDLHAVFYTRRHSRTQRRKPTNIPLLMERLQVRILPGLLNRNQQPCSSIGRALSFALRRLVRVYYITKELGRLPYPMVRAYKLDDGPKVAKLRLLSEGESAKLYEPKRMGPLPFFS